MAIYSTPRWRRIRRRHLDLEPDCRTCGAPATDVDHEPPRAQLIAEGVNDPDDDVWLQSLCHLHHSSKTATNDGGFGRSSKPIDER